MKCAILCVVSCLTSLRGASKCLSMLGADAGERTPTWTSVQNWVLRFGLYVLNRPVPRRSDWVLLLDQAINLGTRKLLVGLVVSLETLRDRKFILRHQDMRVVSISTEEHCDGPMVATVIADVAAKIGCPAQIITDGGSNLKRGIRIFQESHPAVVASNDITHATALMLKNMFDLDRRLSAFTRKITEVRRLVAQTEFACLAPPKPRDKSRWLNMDPYLAWAERVQALRSAPHDRGRPSKAQADRNAKRERLFSWLDDFRADIADWQSCLVVVTMANTLVKREGLSKTSAERFRPGWWGSSGSAGTPASRGRRSR